MTLKWLCTADFLSPVSLYGKKLGVPVEINAKV